MEFLIGTCPIGVRLFVVLNSFADAENMTVGMA